MVFYKGIDPDVLIILYVWIYSPLAHQWLFGRPFNKHPHRCLCCPGLVHVVSIPCSHVLLSLLMLVSSAVCLRQFVKPNVYIWEAVCSSLHFTALAAALTPCFPTLPNELHYNWQNVLGLCWLSCCWQYAGGSLPWPFVELHVQLGLLCHAAFRKCQHTVECFAC